MVKLGLENVMNTRNQRKVVVFQYLTISVTKRALSDKEINDENTQVKITHVEKPQPCRDMVHLAFDYHDMALVSHA